MELFIGGDMKFIQLLLGLCGSTGNYACHWCIIPKSERFDTSKPWNFFHSEEQKRTLQLSCLNKHFGSKNYPLVNIEPHHIVIDELHLEFLLRITDVLISNVIDDACDLETKENIAKQKSEKPRFFGG